MICMCVLRLLYHHLHSLHCLCCIFYTVEPLHNGHLEGGQLQRKLAVVERRPSVEVPLYYCYWLIIHGLLILVSYFQNDFIVLGLVDGKVTLLANAGSTPLTLQTNKRFNDGQWHFVTIHVDGILWVFLVLMCLVSKPHPCWPLSCVAPSLFSDSRGQCVISIF